MRSAAISDPRYRVAAGAWRQKRRSACAPYGKAGYRFEKHRPAEPRGSTSLGPGSSDHRLIRRCRYGMPILCFLSL